MSIFVLGLFIHVSFSPWALNNFPRCELRSMEFPLAPQFSQATRISSRCISRKISPTRRDFSADADRAIHEHPVDRRLLKMGNSPLVLPIWDEASRQSCREHRPRGNKLHRGPSSVGRAQWSMAAHLCISRALARKRGEYNKCPIIRNYPRFISVLLLCTVANLAGHITNIPRRPFFPQSIAGRRLRPYGWRRFSTWRNFTPPWDRRDHNDQHSSQLELPL